MDGRLEGEAACLKLPMGVFCFVLHVDGAEVQ